MTTEERRVQLVTEVDTSGSRAGFDEVSQQAGQMAGNVTRSGERAERAVNGIGNGASRGARNVQAAERNIVNSIQRTTAQMESGSRTSAQYYEVLARQRGVNPNVLRPYLDQLRSVEAAQLRAAQSAGQSAGQIRAAMSQVPAQMTDILVSLQGGQNALTVALQQGGQLRDSFGGIIPAAKALGGQLLGLVNPYTVAGAAAIGLAIAYNEGAKESRAYNLAIATTGNAAGTTVGQMSDAAAQVAEFTHSQREAAQVLASMIETGRIAGSDMAELAVVAINAQRDLGREVSTTVGEYANLGKSPVETLRELSERYHHVSAATFARVKALQDEGRVTEAVTLAQQAHAEGIEKSRQRVLDGLTDWERGWARIKKEISGATDGAIDFFLNFSRQEGPQQAITRLLAERERIESNIAIARGRRDSWGERQQAVFLERNKAEINAARDKLKAEKDRGEEEKRNGEATLLRQRLEMEGDKLLSREQQRRRALAAAETQAKTLGLNEAETTKYLAIVRKEYSDVDEAARKKQEEAAKKAAELLKKEAGVIAEMSGLLPTFADDWKFLGEMYARGAISLAQLEKSQADLLAKQPAIKAAAEQEAAAAKIRAQFQADYAKGLAATSDVYTKRVEDVELEAARNEDLARTYGMTKSAIEQLELARLQEQLAQRSTLGLTLDEIAHLEKLIDAKKRNAAAIAAMEQVDAAKKAAEEWQRAADSIEQSLTDALLRGFESGKGFGQNLVDTLKNMFNTLVLRPVISAVVNPAAMSLTSGLSGAGSAAAGAGTLGSAGSILSGVGSLSGSFGSGLASGLSAWSAEGSVAGLLNSGALFGGGIANGLGAIVGSLGPIALGIAGAAKLVDKAFGRGPKEYADSQTLNGSLGAGGFTGTLDAEWVKKGGWFRSDKKGTDRNPVDAELAAGLTSAYDAIKASSSAAARVLGINADSIANRAQAIKIALGKDEEANQKLIAEFFTGVANTVAGELLPEIGKFQAQGEAASATLERLAVNFTAVDQILLAMGTTSLTAFRAVGTGSIEARERLLALAGGIDALATQTTFFNDNFLSEAERVAIIQKPLQEGLAALGFAGLTTADQFKSAVQGLVSSGALATEQGAKQYAGLLALAPQFKTVSDYLKSVGDAAAETARQAAEAAEKAVEAARQAAEAARQAVLDQATGLLSGVDGAFSVLQRVVDRQKAALQDDIQARTEAVNKLKSLTEAARNSLNGMRTPEQQQASQAQARADIGAALAIARAGGGLGDTEALQKAISALGNGPSMDAYATYQDYQRDLFGTQGDLAELAKLTDGALTIEERALKAAQDQAKQLDEMLKREQEQIDVLKGLSTIGLSIEQAIKALQGAMAAARQNPVVSASAAINSAYQQHLGRAPDAAGFEWWQNAAAGGAPISQIVDGIANSAEADLRKLYESALGRAPDAEGLAYWMKAFGPTMDAAEKAEFLKGAKPEFDAIAAGKQDEFLKLRGFAVGTNRVPYDMPALIHEGERIIPAADNRELMRRLANPAGNADALAAEVARLSAVMEAQQRENVELREALRDGLLAIATHTSNTATHLDDVVNGRKPLVTEVATT